MLHVPRPFLFPSPSWERLTIAIGLAEVLKFLISIRNKAVLNALENEITGLVEREDHAPADGRSDNVGRDPGSTRWVCYYHLWVFSTTFNSLFTTFPWLYGNLLLCFSALPLIHLIPTNISLSGNVRSRFPTAARSSTRRRRLV